MDKLFFLEWLDGSAKKTVFFSTKIAKRGKRIAKPKKDPFWTSYLKLLVRISFLPMKSHDWEQTKALAQRENIETGTAIAENPSPKMLVSASPASLRSSKRRSNCRTRAPLHRYSRRLRRSSDVFTRGSPLLYLWINRSRKTLHTSGRQNKSKPQTQRMVFFLERSTIDGYVRRLATGK